MKIKAIFMDLDGTVLRSDHTVSEKLKEKLKELQDKGIKIFISTGRTYTSSLPYISELGITTPVITYNGGRIMDSLTQEVVYEDPVPAEVVKELIKFSRREEVHLNLYVEDLLHIENESEEGLGYSQKAGIPYTLVNFDDFMNKESTKALFIGKNEKLEKLKKELEDKFPQCEFVFSQTTYLEVLNKGVSKGRAVGEIMKKYGFTPEEVMAFGDQWNDLSMLKAVKHGYLMGNATEELKREIVPHMVTLSNDDDGIYHIIKDVEV